MKSKGTVLLVDDNPDNLRLLIETLAADGFTVRPADSGELALAAVAALQPDLILLDIRLPGIDGMEVCRRLKAAPESRDIPVIFISAAGEEAAVVQGLSLGAVDFISKPIRSLELLARVRTHVGLRRLRVQVEAQATEMQLLNRKLETELAERVRSEATAHALGQEIRTSYRATLNLIDDAVEARRRLEATNEALRKEIAERQSAEEALRQQADVLRVRNETLTRFNLVAVGRELRMIELKREINELCAQLGAPTRHHVDPKPALPVAAPKSM